MNNKEMILGIDIGGTHLRMGLVDRQYRLTAFEMVPSTVLEQGDTIRAIGQLIGEYMTRHAGYLDPVAVSMGFPSTIDKECRTVLSTPNLRGLDRLPVVEKLGKALGMPVMIDRDVNLLLMNDMRRLELENEQTVIGCYFGTGLGNAICFEGRILRGKNGVAGELGHIPVIGNALHCGCGNTGCLETLAGGRYLKELTRVQYPGEALEELFVRHSGDRTVLEYIGVLASAVATEVNILDPDAVVIGGGIPMMPGFPKEILCEKIREKARKPYPCEGLRIHFSADAQENGVLGAGIKGWKTLNGEEKEE